MPYNHQQLSHYITRKSLKHVAEGGTLAEEVISTIRTAQAFGSQKTLSTIYESYVEQSLQINLTASAWSGAGFGVTFFIIYSAYALSKLSEMISILPFFLTRQSIQFWDHPY